jgi:hypothetical protein
MRHFAMCEKCKELDQSIEHYRRLSQSITDQPTIDRFKEAIGNLFDQKLALPASRTKKVRPPQLAASFVAASNTTLPSYRASASRLASAYRCAVTMSASVSAARMPFRSRKSGK